MSDGGGGRTGPESVPESGQQSAVRRSARAVLAGAAALVFAAAIGGIALAIAGSQPSHDGDVQPSTQGASVDDDPDRAVLPEDCAGLYGSEMFEMLSGESALPLNDGTTFEPPFSRSPDVAALQGSPELTCTWGSAGDFGLLTQVNEVDASQASAAQTALRAVGFSCSEQSDGTRCEVSHASGDAQWGETHVLRGNIWLCTFWLNITVNGYTDDMVAALWG